MSFGGYDGDMIERCTRCGAPSGIVMAYDYGERRVWLDDITEAVVPGLGYPLCGEHAERLTPPMGWTLEDRRRPVRPLFVSLEVA
jgi:hypothetical protein